MALSSRGTWGAVAECLLGGSVRVCINAAPIQNMCQREEQARGTEAFICWQRFPCMVLGRRQKSLYCPIPPPGGMSYNKHRQQFTHTESCNCVQTAIHATLHRKKTTSPSNPFLMTDTSALQHTGATATHAETSLLILNKTTWVTV